MLRSTTAIHTQTGDLLPYLATATELGVDWFYGCRIMSEWVGFVGELRGFGRTMSMTDIIESYTGVHRGSTKSDMELNTERMADI